MSRVAIVSALLLLAALSPAHAWPSGDAPDDTPAAAPAAACPKDYAALQDAADAAWTATPLAIKNAVFTKDKVPGYGQFEVRDTAQYKTGDVVHLYLEPVFFDWKPAAGGKFGIELSADLTIQTKTGGSKIIDQKNFLSLAESFTTKAKTVDMTANITLEDSLAATDYVITFTVHDAVGNKVASVDMPFAIVK